MRKHLGKYNKELSEILKSKGPVALICHFNPDGDAIGSMLGLFRYLKTLGKECMMISPGPLQKFLLWLPEVEKIIDFSKDISIISII